MILHFVSSRRNADKLIFARVAALCRLVLPRALAFSRLVELFCHPRYAAALIFRCVAGSAHQRTLAALLFARILGSIAWRRFAAMFAAFQFGFALLFAAPFITFSRYLGSIDLLAIAAACAIEKAGSRWASGANPSPPQLKFIQSGSVQI